MDPPPRSLARRSVRLLHGRDPTWFNRIQAWFAGDCSWPMAGSPRIIAWQTTRSRAVCRRAREGQGQAFGGAEEAPSLTLAARDGDGQYAVGAEECSRRGSNKRINKQGRDKMVCTTLDKESPIQAVCGKAARTDLCGGREVTRVPTAKIATPAPSKLARRFVDALPRPGARCCEPFRPRDPLVQFLVHHLHRAVDLGIRHAS
jgi:hypothetical protein